MMLIFGITAAISVGGMAGLGVLQQGLPGFEVWLPIVIIAVAGIFLAREDVSVSQLVRLAEGQAPPAEAG